LRLRWSSGVWELNGPDAESDFDTAGAEARCEAVFINLAADIIGQGRDLSRNKSQSFAPAIFASIRLPMASPLSSSRRRWSGR
jgi:hypothetical protein